MPRSLPPALRALALALVLVGVLAVSATSTPVGAQAPGDDPTVTAAPIPPPRASMVVDVDTGEVILAHNEREAVPPASTTKIITVMLAAQRLGLDAEITVPPEVLFAEPRRLQLQPGEVWGVDDLIYAAMLCSCNDAAWALGQMAAGGAMDDFAGAAGELAEQLGLEDDPVLRDPAGLDGPESIGGGNLLSARDLAIAARAYLADPELAAIAAAPRHDWIGGDGEDHFVTNLNRFLGHYDGAFGLKTGATSRAGLTFVGAAEREGRRLLAVVLGSQNHYAHTRSLLDQGFLLAEAEEVTDDVLPPVPEELGGEPATTTTTTQVPAAPEAGGVGGAHGEAAPAPAEGILRSQAPPPRPGPDRTGDRARQVVWGVIAVVLALGALAVVVAARRRLRRGAASR